MSTLNIQIAPPNEAKAYFDTTRPDFPIPTLAFRWITYEGDIRLKVVCNKQIGLRPTSGRDDIDYFVLGSVRYMPREAILKHNFKDDAELREHMSIQAEHVLQLTCKLKPLERELFAEGYYASPVWALCLNTPQTTLQVIIDRDSGQLLATKTLNDYSFA